MEKKKHIKEPGSAITHFIGMMMSILASTPVGATIVTANAIAYLAFGLIGRAVR